MTWGQMLEQLPLLLRQTATELPPPAPHVLLSPRLQHPQWRLCRGSAQPTIEH